MISDTNEYEKACEELEYLEAWLNRLRKDHPGPEHGLTKAGIRKMISHLHEELAVFEGGWEVEKKQSEKASSRAQPSPQNLSL